LYKEWKDFRERKQRELEIIAREENMWQKIVRYITGNSPLSSKLDESSNTQDKY
jgi:hypothetical protein